MTSAVRPLLSVLLLGVLALVAPVACAPGGGGDDAGDHEHDAGAVADAGGETPDAGPAECTDHCRIDEDDEAECGCLWNDECGDGYACLDYELPDGGGVDILGRCQCGARGTGETGAACDNAADCASGLCTEDHCTKRCEEDSDCPSPFTRCVTFIGACGFDT